MRLLGIAAGVAPRTPLAQQIPAHVQFDLDRPQAVRVGLECAGVLGGLASAQLVLLGDQPLDPSRSCLIAHDPILRVATSAARYDRAVSHAAALVDEIANELQTWPGVSLERTSDETLVALYEGIELGVLDRSRGLAELRFPLPERDSIVETGEAEPASPAYDSEDVSHDVRGPSDTTAVLELFDRRYREVRGEGPPYSSADEP